ncbi:MAG: nucleotide exchange factor GrpE [Chloroflexi bacterium]|nr:nucleotide exchange factor GrpE [Chloroflexota bacterium]MBM3172170.1 nucleotide exchange factor GrpE [Chloroflexota bacterium]MBM3175819.1 nucleotide exchange factor GrpE [Chloroflexota bacterium]MBM4449482.1 nucleotide exchange factor GrpE [Chloroflexota bacterium]
MAEELTAEEKKLLSEMETPELDKGEEALELPEGLEKSLAEEKEKAAKCLDNWQRTEADFRNYKKRAEQEKEELTKWAVSGLILNILPVVDDLERAFASLPVMSKDSSWLDGMKLIQRKLLAVLEAQGLSEINALGETFDPGLHEAVVYQEGDEGKVIAVARKGYKLNDKVLRATQVVVGKGHGETNTQPEGSAETDKGEQG